MTWKPIRQLIADLFGPGPRALYEIVLKDQLAKTERERDYFRTRAERLELRLIPEPIQRPVRPSNAVPVGRKTWAQVQAEHAEKIKQEVAEEAQKEAVKGAN
jgi:hypothetical protein